MARARSILLCKLATSLAARFLLGIFMARDESKREQTRSLSSRHRVRAGV